MNSEVRILSSRSAHGGNMFIVFKALTSALAFIALVAAPQIVKAESEIDLQECLNKIQSSWPVIKSETLLEGNTRHNTSCQLSLQMTQNTLDVSAVGNPLQVNFSLGQHDPKIQQSLLACKVDKEKLHIVFEEKQDESFEKRDRIQMTLLKRHGKGLSLILAKREMRILRPAQHTSLICHLN